MYLDNFIAQGTCCRRKIGCILLDKNNYFLASGFNGPINGECNCPGKDTKAGVGGNVECYALHAEVRALTSLTADQIPHLHKCITNKAPCRNCVLLLLGTSCQEIEFEIASNETENKQLWEASGRKWVQKATS